MGFQPSSGQGVVDTLETRTRDLVGPLIFAVRLAVRRAVFYQPAVRARPAITEGRDTARGRDQGRGDSEYEAGLSACGTEGLAPSSGAVQNNHAGAGVALAISQQESLLRAGDAESGPVKLRRRADEVPARSQLC